MFWSDAWLYHDLYISPLTDAHCTILKMAKKKCFSFLPGFINLFMFDILAFLCRTHWALPLLELAWEVGILRWFSSLVLFQHPCVFISRLTSPAPRGACLIYPLSSFPWLFRLKTLGSGASTLSRPSVSLSAPEWFCIHKSHGGGESFDRIQSSGLTFQISPLLWATSSLFLFLSSRVWVISWGFFVLRDRFKRRLS